MSSSRTKFDASRSLAVATFGTVALLGLIWAGSASLRGAVSGRDLAPLSPGAGALPAPGPRAERVPVQAAAAAVATAERAPRAMYVDPSEEPLRGSRDGTERHFYEAFLREARRGELSLERASGILHGAGPDCEKVGLLRAAYAAGGPDRVSLFTAAIAELPDVSGPRGESVPSFAVRFLAARAHSELPARAVLEAVTIEGAPTNNGEAVAPNLRRRAAASWAAWASPVELGRLSLNLLSRETDLQLLEGVLEGLSRNPHREAADNLLSLFERRKIAAAHPATSLNESTVRSYPDKEDL